MIAALQNPGIHEERLKEFFGRGRRGGHDGGAGGPDLVLLLFSNRCGSNLLAEYLRSTSVFAGFHEQLNHDVVEHTCEVHSLKSFSQYANFIVRSHGGDKPVFGLKASWDQAMMLYRMGLFREFSSVKAIHLVRPSTIDQAISMLIADETDQWTVFQSGRPDAQVNYDYSKITSILKGILDSESFSRLTCEVLEIPCLNVTYDEVVDNPQDTVERIASFVGYELKDWAAPDPSLKKQASQRNVEFRQRFIDDFRADIKKEATSAYPSKGLRTRFFQFLRSFGLR